MHAATANDEKQYDEDHEDTSISESLSLWHVRLGHASLESVKQFCRKDFVRGLHLQGDGVRKRLCQGCMESKLTKQTLRTNKNRSTERCAVFHCKICSPMSAESFSGLKYFVFFIDKYLGYIAEIPMKRKREVLNQFKHFQIWLERKYDCPIKRLHSDIGGDYVGIRSYLKEQGI